MTLTCQACHKLVTVPLESLRNLPGPPFHYDLDAGPCCGVCLPLSVGARIEA